MGGNRSSASCATSSVGRLPSDEGQLLSGNRADLKPLADALVEARLLTRAGGRIRSSRRPGWHRLSRKPGATRRKYHWAIGSPNLSISPSIQLSQTRSLRGFLSVVVQWLRNLRWAVDLRVREATPPSTGDPVRGSAGAAAADPLRPLRLARTRVLRRNSGPAVVAGSPS